MNGTMTCSCSPLFHFPLGADKGYSSATYTSFADSRQNLEEDMSFGERRNAYAQGASTETIGEGMNPQGRCSAHVHGKDDSIETTRFFSGEIKMPSSVQENYFSFSITLIETTSYRTKDLYFHFCNCML
jgi:hypothetical protein